MGGISIRLVEPCGPPDTDALELNLEGLRAEGFEIHDHGPFSRNSLERLELDGARQRASQLQNAFEDPGAEAILCVRGGYGASELLHHLDWGRLTTVSSKCLIGFSDVSALQSAVFTRLGWPSLHAPMPGSPLWQSGAATERLIHLLCAPRGTTWSGEIAVEGISSTDSEVSGPLFGGCLSVLSGLIGTPYLPKSLHGGLLFFEDTGESAPRVLRYWRQWLDSGLLEGVGGVVFGRFTQMKDDGDEKWLLREMASRTPCPAWVSPDFGHVPGNLPLGVGSVGRITNHQLRWQLDRPFGAICV